MGSGDDIEGINYSCTKPDETIDQNAKTRYNRPGWAIFFSVILLSSALIAYPSQTAYAHESGWHDFYF